MLRDLSVAIALRLFSHRLAEGWVDRTFFSSRLTHAAIFISQGLIFTLGAFYVQNSLHWTGYLPQNE